MGCNFLAITSNELTDFKFKMPRFTSGDISLFEGSRSLFKSRMSFIDGVNTGVRLIILALAGLSVSATIGKSLILICKFLNTFPSVVTLGTPEN